MSKLRRQLTTALRAEMLGTDLADNDDGGIDVLGITAGGSEVYLGSVSGALVCQDQVAAKAAIERIKFFVRGAESPCA